MQRFQHPELARDRDKDFQCEIDGDIAAIDHRLQDDLEHLARRHLGGQSGANGLLERIRAARHRELPDHHQEARALVEHFPVAEAVDGVIEPQLGEVRVEAVAQGDAIVERLGLKTPAGLVGAGVVLVLHCSAPVI